MVEASAARPLRLLLLILLRLPLLLLMMLMQLHRQPLRLLSEICDGKADLPGCTLGPHADALPRSVIKAMPTPVEAAVPFRSETMSLRVRGAPRQAR
jgi:hypothetical protein